jgi:hypothetical protein
MALSLEHNLLAEDLADDEPVGGPAHHPADPVGAAVAADVLNAGFPGLEG